MDADADVEEVEVRWSGSLWLSDGEGAVVVAGPGWRVLAWTWDWDG